MGAKVELVLPLSLVNAGQMLNVTAVTLGDQLQIAFLAIPDAVPEVDKLARYASEAFATFASALSEPAAATKAPVKRAARVRTPAGQSDAKPAKSTARGGPRKRVAVA